MALLGVDTVSIVVSDRRKAIEWYRDVLGVAVVYAGQITASVMPERVVNSSTH